MTTPNNNSLNNIATNLYGDTQILNFNFPTINTNEMFKKQDGDNITGTKIYSLGTNTSKTLSLTTDDPVIPVQVGHIKGEIDGALQKLHLSTTGDAGDAITITSQGRVGINIPEPEEDFEVDGSIQIDSGNVARLKFQQSGQTPHALGEIDGEQDGTNGGDLQFYTKVDGGSVTEKLRINNVGAIGIAGATYGTTNQVLTSNGSGSSVSWTNQTDTTYSAGTGVTINGSNQISIGQSVATSDSPEFVNQKLTNHLRLGPASRNQNIVSGYSGYNLAGSSTQHVMETYTVSQANGNWNTMSVEIHYCIGQPSLGVPHGRGIAKKEFYFVGNFSTSFGFGNNFSKDHVLGNNVDANFRMNYVSPNTFQVVYLNSNSNVTQVSATITTIVSYANLA